MSNSPARIRATAVATASPYRSGEGTSRTCQSGRCSSRGTGSATSGSSRSGGAQCTMSGTASAGGASGAKGSEPMTTGGGASGRRSASRTSWTRCASGLVPWGIPAALPRPSRVCRGEARKRSVAGR